MQTKLATRAFVAGLSVAVILTGWGKGAPSPRWGATARAPLAALRRGEPPTGSANWPELHGDPQLTGYAPGATVTDGNAASLGVAWALNLNSPALASPVVAYDAPRRAYLIYQGADGGSVFAVNEATGRIAWSTDLGSPIRDTPVVAYGGLWVGTTAEGTLFKLNASTGAVECSLRVGHIVYSSPVAATPPGGLPSVYFGTVWRPGVTGFVAAVNAANCRMEWKFNGFPRIVAVWGSISYAVDASGHGRLYFGTSDPDQSVYSLSALTGKEIWRHRTTSARGDYDVGAGITVSPPKANGFPDGVAYVPAKDGFVYALDLSTGHVLWQFDMSKDAGLVEESLSTAALDGTNLVVGCTTGAYDLNAVTGAKIWSYVAPGTATEVISSPAISGPPGDEVVSFGDVGDYFRVLSLASGKELYRYHTASWIAAGPALSQDNVVIASNGGYLYDFRPGGGNSPPPTTTIRSPAAGAFLGNPKGDVTVRGQAGDAAGVGAVFISVRQGGAAGRWWDAASRNWHLAPMVNSAAISSPGGKSATWSFRFPAAEFGSTYLVQVNAASSDGVPDARGVLESFFVRPAHRAPALAVSERYIEPATHFFVSGKGFRPGEAIEVAIPGAKLARDVAASSGTFRAVVAMPTVSILGPATVYATGLSSKRESSAPVYITESWPEMGSDASRTGYEANDPIIGASIDPAQNILLDLAWQFPTGGSSATSPAVVDDVAYVGNGAGELFAVEVSDGRPLWSWRTPTHAAITGAPAVDSTRGTIFVGGADGYLYAVSSSGHLRWSRRLYGTVQSPALIGSELYVASTSGRVAAFTVTGARTWVVSAGGSVRTAPALDARLNDLLVTAAVVSGTRLQALDASTGARLWAVRIPGSVRSSPSIGGGVSYVGSSDGFVYAYSDTGGARVWSFDAGAAVQESPAVALGRVIVGSDNGTLFLLDAGTGKLIVANPMGLRSRGVIDSGSTALEVGSNGDTGGIRISGDIVWGISTGQRFETCPAASGGAFYASTTSGELLAYTPAGLPPI